MTRSSVISDQVHQEIAQLDDIVHDDDHRRHLIQDQPKACLRNTKSANSIVSCILKL